MTSLAWLLFVLLATIIKTHKQCRRTSALTPSIRLFAAQITLLLEQLLFGLFTD